MQYLTYNRATVRISGEGDACVTKDEEYGHISIDAIHLQERDPTVPCRYTISPLGIVIKEEYYNLNNQLHRDDGPAKILRCTRPNGKYVIEWEVWYYKNGMLIKSETLQDV